MTYSTSVFRNFTTVSSALLILAALSACAPMGPQTSSAPYPSGNYPQSAYPTQNYPQSAYPTQNQQSAYVEYGRVSNIEVLQTQGTAQGSGVGALIGGVAGAVVGRQIGGGSGRDAATVVGALGGAVAGNAIEKNRAGAVTESFRISVQMDNGSYRSYDLPTNGQLRTGDRVRIENGQLSRM